METYALELFLKSHDARLSYGGRWLVWNEDQWEVYGQRYHQRVKRILVTGFLVDALRELETGSIEKAANG